jgi:hypothetical protein
MTASRIKVDGILDEPGWQAAPVIPLPFEWTPGDNIPAPVKTECLVTYDLHNLYVGFRLFDPEPRKIRAHLMDRDDTDSLILDDHISIMVDAFNDERRGFHRATPWASRPTPFSASSKGTRTFPGTRSGRRPAASRAGVGPSRSPSPSTSFASGKRTARRPGASARSGPGRGMCATASRPTSGPGTSPASSANSTSSAGSRGSHRAAASSLTPRSRAAARTPWTWPSFRRENSRPARRKSSRDHG